MKNNHPEFAIGMRSADVCPYLITNNIRSTELL